MNNETPNPEPKAESTTPKSENIEVTSPKPETLERDNSQPEILDIENSISEGSKSEEESITKKPIYPCCCGANQESFFFVFTILMIFDQSFAFLRQIVYFVSNGGASIVLSLLLSGAFLAFMIYVLIDYKKTGNYGSSYAYILSIITLVLSSIVLGVSILIFVLFCIIGATAISFLDNVLPITGAAFGFAVVLFLTIILFLCYVTYLLYLYYTVVKNKKEEIEKMTKNEQKEEDKVEEESQAATEKPQLDEAKNMEANLV